MTRKREQPTALLILRGDELQVMFPDDCTVAEAVRRAVRAALRPKPSRVVDYRTWTIAPAAFDSVAEALKARGFRVESYKQGVKPSQVPPSTDRAALGVCETAPWPVVEAAYRTLAKLYHPDVAGATLQNTERMKQINLAYERLTKGARR